MPVFIVGAVNCVHVAASVEIVLGKVVMTAHEQKSIVRIAATRELSKVVICNVGLTFCGRI